MAIIEVAKIQIRRGQELQTGVPRLDPGEFGWAEDTEHLYIGKRIAEGANSDENSRILTESDLNNIFSLLGYASTATVNTLQRYRGLALPNTIPTTVQIKLDNTVSLTDFGVVTSSTATDITLNFQHAVADLNNTENDRRQLRIPAGNYLINGSVNLPSYTTIVGEGSGLTKLILTNPATNLFKSDKSKNINLSGMTLEYANNLNSNNALLSLNTVSNAIINDIRFTTSSTFTMTNFGVGISLTGAGGPDDIVETCKDIYIDNCEFFRIGTGIDGAGTVLHSVVSNSVFSNLQQGIKFHTGTNISSVPLDGVIISNRFEKIIKEGIFVESPTDVIYNRTNQVSENNIFREVGTGPDRIGDPQGDLTTSTAYPVIAFYGQGNRSINDHFERQVKAYSVGTPADFYYNPIVKGSASVIGNEIYTTIIPPASLITTTTITNLLKIPLTGSEQMFNIEYTMSNATYSRKGRLIANITGGPPEAVFGSVSDYYDYSYAGGDPKDPYFDINYASYTATNYVTLMCMNANNGVSFNVSYKIEFLS